MRTIKISKRLSLIASFLSKGTYFADIGSDHAYLACYVCLNDGQARAIAGDVNKGPYLSAKKTVENYNLQHAIDVRLGNGLAVLNNDDISELVIAGMGGPLIKSILELGKDQINTVRRIIAQPNIGEENVRKWFVDHGFTICEEAIIEENGKIYEIIVADRNGSSAVEEMLTEKELYFGPYLLKRPSAVFHRKWQLRKIKIEAILQQLQRSKTIDDEKIKRFTNELSWIEEVLREKSN